MATEELGNVPAVLANPRETSVPSRIRSATGTAPRAPAASPLLPRPRTHVPPTDSPRPSPPPDAPEDTARFRRTLVKVMSMQVVALLVLWWLQARYDR